MKLPRTKMSFDNAYDQAMPEHGEGWDDFAGRIQFDMGSMEIEIQELKAALELYRGQVDMNGNNSASDSLSDCNNI